MNLDRHVFQQRSFNHLDHNHVTFKQFYSTVILDFKFSVGIFTTPRKK